ncbi:DHA2 family efflux MFS transporter permease subunit [Nocardioides sp.]|uniref:DHA2 family efflux MFS transporter permease subunit n=1 Tax=Nocardioides sp. TaxID=35761 RepID=UPI0027257AB9|nr:DHA2 family efflux MFS transporter permease subunit [Nocardioides sp.]MDO9457211.1 DHA2 family efflux MFS transporter permease subunit [Nocardioides sp.]
MATTDDGATTETDTTESGDYSHAQILAILAGLMMGMFLGALDQTIVSTSIRTIADDLNGLSIQAWVTTAYLITATITTPIYGKLGDLYGRKKLFLFAISVFIVGSALCSFAGSMTQLAAFRALQGLGAGGLFTLVLAIIGDLVSPRERARYTGYFMAMFGTSSVLGPLIGGFFAGTDSIFGVTGWRWVFLVNVPIGLAALVVVTRTLHLKTPAPTGKIRIDWWGAASLVVALVPVLTVAEQGREWGWVSGRSITAYVVGAIGLVAFVLAERAMGDAALIPPKLFKIRAALVTITASVVVGVAMFGGIFLLPLYMQIVHGASPTESGLLTLPMVAGLMIASIGSGRIISRTGQVRMFPIVGSALVVVALVLLSFTTADTALVLVMLAMLVLGLGLGQCMQPLLLTMQSAVPPSDIGVATSSATFFRQMGGTLGVAVLLSVLFGTVGGNISTAFADEGDNPKVAAALQDPSFQDTLAGVQDDSSVIETLDPAVAHPIKVGFAESMDTVFLLAAGAGLLAFLILLLMPKVELRATSAAAAARAESGTGPPRP